MLLDFVIALTCMKLFPYIAINIIQVHALEKIPEIREIFHAKEFLIAMKCVDFTRMQIIEICMQMLRMENEFCRIFKFVVKCRC